MARTKEEKYILKMYEEAMRAGNISHEVDRYEIGLSLGYSSKVVNPLCNILAQANFIKKTDDTKIHLTSRGEELAKTLLATPP